MNPQVTTLGRSQSAAVSATNKVVKNTYMLLAMTLAFSAATAGAAMALNLPHPGIILTLVGYFGLLFLTTKFRDSGLGIAFVFGLTGFMGYTLGPIPQRLSGHAQRLAGGDDGDGRHRGNLPSPVGLRDDHSQGFQLHGRLPHGRHPGCLPRRPGGNLLPYARPVAGSIRNVRAADVRPHPV